MNLQAVGWTPLVESPNFEVMPPLEVGQVNVKNYYFPHICME